MADNHLSDFLKTLTFFSGLLESDMSAFLGTASVRTYKKGDGLFHQGDDANAFYVIISGWIKLFRNTTEGEEALVGLFSRGDVFGEAALFTGSVFPLSAQAAGEARVLVIPGDMLKARAKKNPEVTSRMLASLSREMIRLQRQNEQMAIMSAPQRIACLLLQLSSDMKGEGGTFSFPYDKSLAASRLGMKPETFSRALAQLRPEGVSVKGAEITIDSFAQLSEYACNHCTALPGECGGLRCAACPMQQMQQRKKAVMAN
ncbi:MAG TPA: Crp/Fnr family transcriptional regulator [Patescibacteria group bacterium]|nr:Crp/Fnr family transcriptional regulator [Patescibacteria group bacterium]